MTGKNLTCVDAVKENYKKFVEAKKKQQTPTEIEYVVDKKALKAE